MLLLVKYAGAQEQLSIKQQGDKLYERYEYFKSLEMYLKLAEKTKNDVKLAERIADCYRNINRYEDAEKWYATAVTDPKASTISHYYYAEVLLRDQKFDLAKQQYKIYFENDPARLALKLAVCDSAALWMGQKSVYKVINDSTLNTGYSDWGLTYDGKTGLIFTSDRKTDESSTDNRTGNSWFKLYEADVNGNNVKQLYLANGLSDVFSNEYHIGPISLNNMADTAYITVTTSVPKKDLPLDKKDKTTQQNLYSRRLQLLMAGKKNGRWTVFGSFPYNNVREYSVGDAVLSKDGRIIYFTSDMPGGEGKTDIWYCEKQANGTWGKPVNCGKTINTPEDDGFPTIGGDGTLYYCSKGLPGMGGYDIYAAKGEKTSWTTPKNLKYPVNSTSDDFYLVTKDGKTGYFSSNREEGKGSDDIYSFTFKPDDTIPAKLITRTDTAVTKPVLPVNTTNGFVLTTIYYDVDKSAIRPDAVMEMDKLVLLLKEHTDLKIEISSYTDSRASYQYNMALSQRRAAAAVEYLVKRGISASRLVPKYYGKTNPVNKCADNVPCTEEEHQLNRRTEFKVIRAG
jgi:outer membrane protein OmpA-like peptidoglycan-associated protein/tetratricopeptide (TPR) repeat protein